LSIFHHNWYVYRLVFNIQQINVWFINNQLSRKGELSYKFIKNQDLIMIVFSKNTQLCANISIVYLLISYLWDNLDKIPELSGKDWCWIRNYPRYVIHKFSSRLYSANYVLFKRRSINKYFPPKISKNELFHFHKLC